MFSEARVLIIGSGAAGIAAASRLLERGLQNFTILEAEGRIGGRIRTVEFADNVVDLGAEWVHGERGNVCYELASNYNVLDSSKVLNDPSKWIFADSQGTIVSKDESTKLLNLYNEIYANIPEGVKNFEGSFGEYFTQEYYKALKKDPFIDPIRAEQFLDWIHKYENIIECSDTWFETSGSGLAEYWLCEGDPLLNWKGKGYRTIFDLLMRKFTAPADAVSILEKVHLNKEVSSIDYRNTNEIIVKTSDSSQYVVDHIIFTPSIGVLKEQHYTLFTPPLPEFKQRAIQGISTGTVNKVFFEFPYTWWPKHTASFNLIWSETDKKEFLQSVGADNEWLGEIQHFSTVDYQPRVLSGWITGPSARYMEGLTDAVILDKLYNLLQKFLGRIYNIPKPDNIIRSSWSSNKHFRGCYSFRSMESEKLNVWARDLAQPITNSNKKPIVLFGGEATHDHYYSTVHGAVETGFREADRLVEYYRCRKSHL